MTLSIPTEIVAFVMGFVMGALWLWVLQPILWPSNQDQGRDK